MAAVGMGIFLSTIDGSIVNVALPTLEQAFDTRFAVVQWVVLAYLLAITTLMLTVGRLADMRGKKPIYAAGFVVFTIGSVLCGLAPTIYWLIGFRVLQAIGAAMILALGMAIITEAFPRHERGRALGISGSIVSIGIILGPTLGGLLIDALSWHWIFFVNLPVGIVGTLLALRYVPDVRPSGDQRFDFLGAVTLFFGLLALLFALTLGQEWGFDDGRVWLLLGSFVLFVALFVAVELRAPQPMIELRLFASRLLTVNLLTGLATFIAISGTLILMPFYLEAVLGYPPRQVGLLLAAVPIGLGIAAPISGSLSDRFGSRPITVIGLVLLIGGYYALSTLTTVTSAAGFVLRFLPLGVGMGIFQSPNNSAIMGEAPQGRLGIVSGLLAVTRTLGQTAGIALIGALWASRVYFHAGAAPAGGPTEAAAAAQVAGLHDAFLALTGLLVVALALSLWTLGRERRESSRA
jgi:EmrB/QacA subfamily drug resistance transporter